MPDPDALARPGPWPGFLLALAFLTRIPVRLPPAAANWQLAEAVWAFPLVGIVAGGGGALVYAGAWAIGLPAGLAALLAVAAQLLLTGALHEDGLADTADGLGGGATVERKLAIMRDSRIGTYGVAAIVLALLLRSGALAALAAPAAVAAALVAAGAVSRWMMVGLLHRARPARADGLGASAGRPGAAATLLAGLPSLAGAAALAIFDPLLVAYVHLAGLAALVLVGRLAYRQIGGYSGDILGAVQQAAEVAILLAVVAALR